MDFLVAVGVGLFVGVVMGALGGGGGIITVPALVFLVGLPAHQATTASLVIVGLSALVGVLSHARAGQVRFGVALVFAALGVVGTTFGSVVAQGVPESVLLGAFSALLVGVAGLMWRKAAGWAASGSVVVSEPFVRWRPVFQISLRRVFLLVVSAALVGFLIGFFGVGGGFAIVPALLLVVRLSMREAVGTSLVVIAVLSLQTVLTKLAVGVALPWPVVVVFTGCAMLGSWFGPRLTARYSQGTLTKSFAVLLVIVAAVMAVGVLI